MFPISGAHGSRDVEELHTNSDSFSSPVADSTPNGGVEPQPDQNVREQDKRSSTGTQDLHGRDADQTTKEQNQALERLRLATNAVAHPAFQIVALSGGGPLSDRAARLSSVGSIGSVGAPVTSNMLEKKDFTFYRADGRTLDELQEKSPRGFEAWTPLGVEGARKFVSIFTGSDDKSGLPKDLVNQIARWGKNPKLSDLSAFIKYTKDRSTVWVSTALNTDAGGQSSGAPLYRIRKKLYEFGIKNGALVALPQGRTSPLKPSLLLDAPSIKEANVIALNHGPVSDDAEVSFLTPIGLDDIQPHSRQS